MFRNLLRLTGLASHPTPDVSTDNEDDLTDQILEDPFAKMLINVDEQGDFALAVDFVRTDHPEAAEITAYTIHMINSGHMAEFIIQALNLWADKDREKRDFVFDVLKHWKQLYEIEKPDKKANKQKPLAVDPSDVFGLKRLKS